MLLVKFFQFFFLLRNMFRTILIRSAAVWNIMTTSGKTEIAQSFLFKPYYSWFSSANKVESANILTVILYITFAAIFFLLHQTFFIKSFPAKANTSCTCTCKPPNRSSVRLSLHNQEMKQVSKKSAGIKCCTANAPKRIFPNICVLCMLPSKEFSAIIPAAK